MGLLRTHFVLCLADKRAALLERAINKLDDQLSFGPNVVPAKYPDEVRAEMTTESHLLMLSGHGGVKEGPWKFGVSGRPGQHLKRMTPAEIVPVALPDSCRVLIIDACSDVEPEAGAEAWASYARPSTLVIAGTGRITDKPTIAALRAILAKREYITRDGFNADVFWSKIKSEVEAADGKSGFRRAG